MELTQQWVVESLRAGEGMTSICASIPPPLAWLGGGEGGIGICDSVPPPPSGRRGDRGRWGRGARRALVLTTSLVRRGNRFIFVSARKRRTDFACGENY